MVLGATGKWKLKLPMARYPKDTCRETATYLQKKRSKTKTEMNSTVRKSSKFNILGLTLGPTKHIVCDKDGHQTKTTSDYQEALALMGRLDMTNSDSYFEIGAGHTTCEDYAFHGSFRVDTKPFYFAVVSDGCSASKDSDFGSRFLARNFPEAAKLAIESLGANYAVDEKVIVNTVRHFLFEKMKLGMNVPLDKPAFDATLV